MSRKSEEHNRQKFADKMREKTLAAKNKKAAENKGSEPTPPHEEAKKD
jgi:hypothetical protein